MNKLKNIFLKIIILYTIFATLLSLFCSITPDKDFEILVIFVAYPMVISIPILYWLYKYFSLKDIIIKDTSNIVNPSFKDRFSLKDVCSITLIHNCTFLFNLGYSFKLFIIEILFILLYFYLKKIKMPNKFYTLFNYIKFIFNYVFFCIIFISSIYLTVISFDMYIYDKTSPGGIGMGGFILIPLIVCPMLISTPILYLIYIFFKKRANKSTNKKFYILNTVFKNLCFINLIHNFIFPHNLFYIKFFMILEIILISIYCLIIIFKLKFNFISVIIKFILSIIFCIMIFISLHLLSKLIVFWVLVRIYGL